MEQGIKSEVASDFKEKFRCDKIKQFEIEDGPTREEMKELLETEKGNVLYLHISLQSLSKEEHQTLLPDKRMPLKLKANHEEVIKMLRTRFNVYKLQSTEGERNSLNYSMYLGLIRDGDQEEKTVFMTGLMKEVKKVILSDKKKYKASQVHIIASLALCYDFDDEINETAAVKEWTTPAVSDELRAKELEASYEESPSKRLKRDENQEESG